MPDVTDQAKEAPSIVNPREWIRGSSDLHADCRVFEVKREKFRHPERDQAKDFFVIESADWVNVIAVTPDHRLILVSQYRFGIRGFSLEIPGGLLESGEEPVAGGMRELLEETGFVAGRARLLASIHPNPAIMSNTCHLVLAEEVLPDGEPSWDADEEISIMLPTVEQAFEWARDGTITHSIVLNAFFFFQPEWERMRRSKR